jgi:hypothetical protein
MPRSKLFILKLAAALSCLACLTGLNLAGQSGVPSSSVSLKNALPTGGTEFPRNKWRRCKPGQGYAAIRVA